MTVPITCDQFRDVVMQHWPPDEVVGFAKFVVEIMKAHFKSCASCSEWLANPESHEDFARRDRMLRPELD